MRRVIAAIVALLFVAACGANDDDAETGLTAEEAHDAVGRAVLAEDDLGDGWDDTDPADDALGRCLTIDATPLATSDLRTFRRDGEGPLASTELTVTASAFADAAVIDEQLAQVEDEGFGGCMASAFEASAGDTELGFEVGDAEVSDEYVVLDGVRSAHLRIPFHASAPGFDFDAELDVVVVSRGQLVSAIVTTAFGEPVDGEDIARWATLLADRQRIGD